MGVYSYYEYYKFDDEEFFTLILKPEKEGKFPVVISHSPYIGGAKEKSE